ncbi:hypothetical protein GC177_09520 [bacterium]|nr:hypothetical protein [bacterium]
MNYPNLSELDEFTKLALLNHAAAGLRDADDTIGTRFLSSDEYQDGLDRLHGFYETTYGFGTHAYTTVRESREFIAPTGLADVFDRVHASLIGFVSALGTFDIARMRGMDVPYPECAALIERLEQTLAAYQLTANALLDGLTAYVAANPAHLPIERHHVAMRLEKQAGNFDLTRQSIEDDLTWEENKTADMYEQARLTYARQHLDLLLDDQPVKEGADPMGWPASASWGMPSRVSECEPFVAALTELIRLNTVFHDDMLRLQEIEPHIKTIPLFMKLPGSAAVPISIANSRVLVGDTSESKQVRPLMTLALAGLTKYGQADAANLPPYYTTLTFKLLDNQEDVISNMVLPIFDSMAGIDPLVAKQTVSWRMLHNVVEKNADALAWIRQATFFSANDATDFMPACAIAGIDAIAALTQVSINDTRFANLPSNQRLLAAMHGLHAMESWDDAETLPDTITPAAGEELMKAMNWLLQPGQEAKTVRRLWADMAMEWPQVRQLMLDLLCQPDDRLGHGYIRQWLASEQVGIHRGTIRHDEELMRQFMGYCHSQILPDDLLVQLTCPVAHTAEAARAGADAR